MSAEATWTEPSAQTTRGGTQAVDGQPVLAPHPSLATSEREPRRRRSRRPRRRARRDRTPASPGRRRAQSAPPCTDARRATGSTVTARIRVRSMTIPPSQLDSPATEWPAASHCDEQVPLPGEVDRIDDVGRAGRSDLERRVPVVHGVVDRVGVEAVVGWREHVAMDPCPQLFELVVFDLGLPPSSVETASVIARPLSRPVVASAPPFRWDPVYSSRSRISTGTSACPATWRTLGGTASAS